MLKIFLSWLSYRVFCVLFFLAFTALFYLIFKWFLIGPDSDYLLVYSLVAACAIYFAAGMSRRRELFAQLKSIEKDRWTYFYLLFRIIIAFIVWAVLCLLFEIADRTVLRFVFVNTYLTEAYGYKWLWIIVFFIERKYSDDRKEIIRRIYNKYYKPKSPKP